MAKLLTFLGRNAAAAMALGVFLGVLMPDLANLARPVLEPTVFLMLAASMMRLDPTRLRRPAAFGPVALALVWILLISPLAAMAVVTMLDLPGPLVVAIVTWSACPPLVSVGAVATIMRLDPIPALLSMIGATILFPFTLPLLLLHLVEIEIEISALALTGRLTLFVAGAAVAALILRRFLGVARMERNGHLLDGIFVVMMLVFAVSIMGDVRSEILERPWRLLSFTAAAFCCSLGMQAATLALFARCGRSRSASIAIASGNRNMAILLAAASSAYGSEIFLFLAVLQFPIYVLPILTAPFYQRWAGDG